MGGDAVIFVVQTQFLVHVNTIAVAAGTVTQSAFDKNLFSAHPMTP
jgi:hypothetical protein